MKQELVFMKFEMNHINLLNISILRKYKYQLKF